MSRKTTTRIQYAALRLFDRLACDALQPAMKKGHIKIASIANTHTFWVADILVVSIDTDYNDK